VGFRRLSVLISQALKDSDGTVGSLPIANRDEVFGNHEVLVADLAFQDCYGDKQADPSTEIRIR
jgi:hypothetical protein